MNYLIFLLLFILLFYFFYQYIIDFGCKGSRKKNLNNKIGIDYEKELLVLCYHDKSLVQRLINRELKKGLSLSSAAEAAYLKLLRDRR